jgi:hypothetical protein
MNLASWDGGNFFFPLYNDCVVILYWGICYESREWWMFVEVDDASEKSMGEVCLTV